MSIYSNYETVIGIEVHTELSTNTKAFCSCTTKFGGEENTHCCPVCVGMPGAMPVLNEKVVEYGVRAGLATNCSINKYSYQDRKNYFYPDLAKGYQVTQDKLPLCYDGHIDIEVEDKIKRIGITRIHLEEDTGKLTHDQDGSLIDYNRCGVPLIETVSEPDINSAQEARAYLETLRNIFIYIGVSDCKMNEGSFRTDVNISVRKKGDKELGTRTEMKNLNSFSNVVKSIEAETKRQIDLIEAGGEVIQETRRWDEASQTTVSMRTKGEAADYRYFRDEDLRPVILEDQYIENIGKSLPELANAKKARYMEEYDLNDYDAGQLVESQKIAKFFEDAVETCNNPKEVANWIMREIFRLLDETEKEEAAIPFEARLLGEMIKLIDAGTISNNIAKQVFEEMWKTGKNPEAIVEEKGLKQINDDDALIEMAKEVLDSNEQSVKDYLGGNKRALKALMGQMMKKTRGKANPQKVNEILVNMLKEME
ncbi:MAG: Asp-tRNA(Asn)/Glu-tRNA(Gln) amidotransferase subunit GatB [Epulopiscium sp.]|nr:Asp-tRNA(Asn)/Glu-tRNA(Gln) amidotransferase subunit GatB [Candidatus Epulonipiscium sp.]